MKLHLVGGFLGSGKTTAIIQAAKLLLNRRMRVGVVTNDQGKYLVDSAFVRLSNLPSVEVGGGCFCCNYDDLNSRLDELIASAAPDIIFAESVGSCADIVATVVKPLLELGEGKVTPASFSVFADARLLLRRLNGDDMPFSEDVVYIYDEQIVEAGLIVANKVDLLSLEQINALESKLPARYPEKPFLLQSSLTEEGVWGWLAALQDGRAAPPEQSLAIDYRRYAAGEASLAWVDQNLRLVVPQGQGRAMITAALERLANELAERGAGVGHLKLIVQAQGVEAKISLTTLEAPGWQQQIPEIPGEEIHLLVNARVELPVEDLKRLLTQAFSLPGIALTLEDGDAFHPREPKPTHRFV